MQLFICVAVVLTSIILFHTHVEASVAMKVVPANPDHPGKCYDDETNTAYTVGEIWGRAGICLQHSCSNGPENKFIIQSEGCGSLGESPSCKITRGDDAKPYPKCCPKLVCN